MDRQTDTWWTDRQADRQTGRQADRQTGRQAEGRQADRQTGRQADRQTDGQTDRQKGIQVKGHLYLIGPQILLITIINTTKPRMHYRIK
jgi:hypothetical protein